MVAPKVQSAIEAALKAFKQYGGFDATTLSGDFEAVFSSEKDFLAKAELLDGVFDDNAQLEPLREVFFDLLLINFFSADVKKLEEDYLDSPEWAKIEDETLDRGTELLNVLLYLNECADEEIEPGLEDYLKEFLLVDEDEFQDEHRIYEPIIANQILIDAPLEEVKKTATRLPADSELKELFYPIVAFFQDIEPTDSVKEAVAKNAVDAEFDMPVYEILINFK
ncbi:hypothetical protein LJ707_14105 [Mucilaginibacter sp. UR6-1]|uniref:hypothetical protein n=1 Tax=Mucilaginibacter sp. UR6-1 TaxID=1435643 RepID=UPI001E49C3F9|nr:hypothetical protein [Mucilaginibacter sp. UR6-1]MCC8410068.1 hypothetical protein [Mucilaginibacter sp. UR6-1]